MEVHIRLGQEICTDLAASSRREWLETNGLGGFASATVSGLNTRRYHGLLVAAIRPPTGRAVLLSKLDETLVIDGLRVELGTNRFPGTIHPEGYCFQTGFRLDPYPIFTFECEGLVLEKHVFMRYGENTTVVEYRLCAPGTAAEVALEVRPLLAFRDYHSLAHENPVLNSGYAEYAGSLQFRPYDSLPALNLAHDAAGVERTGYWYRTFEYEAERDRGLDFQEDLFQPCTLHWDLRKTATATLVASTEAPAASDAAPLREAEVARRAALREQAPDTSALAGALAVAADAFLVSRGEQKTVIAGYHWFTDWGRDTMIALPGLTLATGRYDEARSILLEFSRYVDRGMVPNRFPDRGEEPEYNTVDASLWYFEAVRALLRKTDDWEWVQEHLYPVLQGIIEQHVAGTRYGIRVEDGLLRSGEPGVQLTWMDAKVGDWVVTPRAGMPVEIQALWYNALRIMEELAVRFDDAEKGRDFARRAEAARKRFSQLFWNEDAGCLYDVIDGDARDGSVRPNQVLALSLTHPILARGARATSLLAVIEKELLTPYGLRSLSPRDSRYVGRYEGGPLQRDGAYHQGTVWAWLMGPFLSAYLRVNRSSKRAREQARQWLEPFRGHLSDAGLGHVSEIFDGDSPYEPRGCVAQAWSVGELLRVMEELKGG